MTRAAPRNALSRHYAPLARLLGHLSIGVEPFVVSLLLGLALLSRGVNMTHYPAPGRFDDEGIYTAQAWAVLRQASLSPYTYVYDHAPAGWITLAGWLGLTGGPHALGSAIDSGRLFMLVLHLAMVALLYHLARKLGCGVGAAALVGALYALSPLAVLYGRPVLLDTIMLFWVLLSLDLLLDGWSRLSRLALSGICFGLAILSKETALFLLPAMLFIAIQQRRAHQGTFAVSGWLLPLLIVISWYPLYAFFKEELLGAGSSFLFFLSGNGRGGGISLVESLQWQAARGGGGLFNLDNQFWQLVRNEWLPRDPLLLIGGVVAADMNLIRGIGFGGKVNRRAFAAGLLGVLPLLYLGRGGIVFDFYLLFALPFLALNIGVLLAPLLERLPAPATAALTLAAIAAVVGVHWASGVAQPLYSERPDATTRATVAWIKANVPPDSLIIARDAFWTDLREPGLGGSAFTGVHSHWKVASDPAVRDGIFKGDWRTVDYVIMSPGLDRELGEGSVSQQALTNAHLVRRWEADGNFTELWKVDRPGGTEARLLVEGNAAIAARFGRDGAFVAIDGTVTSEAQSYALLRAVWSDDRAAFDLAWAWTRDHLLDADGLLAWQWRDGAVIDPNTATDADTDTALALLLAGQRWGDAGLRDAGLGMVRAVWAREVATVDGKPYITAGDWAARASDRPIALNPSYFSPYVYGIFAEVDKEHDWYGVIDTGYRVLFDASTAPLGAPRSAGLPPDWIGLDRASGEFVPFQLDRGQGDTTRYGYDAVRTYWRVALHYRWNYDGRAESYLRNAGFLRDEAARKGFVSAVYAHDGTILEAAPNPIANAGALAALLTLDPAVANRLYADQFVGGVNRGERGITWGVADDIYAQEWSWFAVAFYANALPNLWTNPAGR